MRLTFGAKLESIVWRQAAYLMCSRKRAQLDRFKEAAHQLDTEENEKARCEKLKEITRQKPAPPLLRLTPPIERHQRPDRFNSPERPRSLQEPVGGAQAT